MKGFKVSVLHVIREPEEDEFPDPEEKEKWYLEYRQQVDLMLEEYYEKRGWVNGVVPEAKLKELEII